MVDRFDYCSQKARTCKRGPQNLLNGAILAIRDLVEDHKVEPKLALQAAIAAFPLGLIQIGELIHGTRDHYGLTNDQ